MIYNWQQPDWPDFRYNHKETDDIVLVFMQETGHINGMLNVLPDDARMDTIINTMVAEALKTSAIEGAYFSRQDVVSSIRNNLGLNKKSDLVKDKMAEGVSKLMVEVRNNYAHPLTTEKLWLWHTMLMAESRNMKIGKWRSHKDAMQIISGALGKEKVHFEAPPSQRVPKEMEQFIKWFNDTAPGGKKEIKKAPVRSAIAHLYFESIHPFEDGNGRIGRAIAEKALSQTLGRPVLLSLSRTIEADKKSYYNALEKASKSNEITPWIKYFVHTALLAQTQTIQLIEFILTKARFFDRFKNLLNERQLKVVKKMIDAGPEGFEGGMNASKYMSITKTSKATATRDLQYLSDIHAFTVLGGGRNTRYVLNFDGQ